MLEALLFALRDFFFLFSYISGRNSFPKPLPAAEEAECIDRMAAGEKAAQDRLIEHNLRLVAHIAKKFQNTNLEYDDMISIGTIGLIKAVSTYKKGNTALATYAARCIENEILMTIRSNKRNRNDISLNDPIGMDKDGCEIKLMDILPCKEEDLTDRVEKKIEANQIKKLIFNVLDEREQKVMLLRYGLLDGVVRAQREVAKTMGISRSYVSRIETRAIQKLVLHMAE